MSGVSGKFELANAQDSDNLCEMKVTTIDLNFHGLPGSIASFLVEGPDGAFLVETGPESTRETLVAALESRGIAPGDLAGIFLTHIHLDHAGAAGSFAGVGVPLYVHEKGARHLVEPSRLVDSARMVYGSRFDSLWGEMQPAPKELVHSLVDGAVVELAGLQIEVIETPGHAFHHHAFRIGRDLFTGDAAGARLSANPYTSVTSAPPQFDLEHTLSSIDKLRSVRAERLFLTHFGEINDPDSHLRAYRETVELNAEFIRQRLAEGFEDLSLQVAYEAFQLEQAYRHQLPRELWEQNQAVNGTAMCADGIRLYWEKRIGAES